MYQDEILQQHDDAFSIDNVSVSLSSSYDSDIFNEKLQIELNKREDTGYRKEKVVLKDGTIHKIESYSTPFTTGSRIRHAITGKRSRCLVGTKDENLFFVVSDTTAKSQEPRKLYYNSPEEYERHYKIVLSSDVKHAYLMRQ